MTYWLMALAVCGVVGGWSVGVSMAPQAARSAAQSYAHELLSREMVSAEAGCMVRVTEQIEALQVQERAFQQTLEEEQLHASERIIGLRVQLREHGIRERIVR